MKLGPPMFPHHVLLFSLIFLSYSGSSRYLASKYGAECTGITLSPVQAKRAQALAAAQGLEKKFVNELARVAAPGATIIIVTWCHRDLSSSEQSLNPDENKLDKICDAYYLPAWCSTDDYVKLLQSLSLRDIKAADWSDYVAPFWPEVIKFLILMNGITSLILSGWKIIRGAMAMPLMVEGYKKVSPPLPVHFTTAFCFVLIRTSSSHDLISSTLCHGYCLLSLSPPSATVLPVAVIPPHLLLATFLISNFPLSLTGNHTSHPDAFKLHAEGKGPATHFRLAGGYLHIRSI
ncbi:hypothetical protein ACH5RR_037779 [Cinchona calisaya]|uniref:Uncharacterized protein n=1 Tax=Cinchona calisaya TaxID=153742 RepID=A0ABD2Y8F5_9GENT